MAVTYNSSQGDGSSSTTSVVITKPTSTAEGDLLIAQIVMSDNSLTITAPSVWTLINSTTVTGGQKSSIYYKIATASEGANYTWSWSFAIEAGGYVSRFTGHLPSAPINTSNATADTSSSSTLTQNGITPTTASCMLVFFTSNFENRSVSGYAIATSNPTWTERYDDGTSLARLSMATAIRPETTSTGNATATLSGSSTHKIGQIIAIEPGVDVTVSADLLTINNTIGNPDKQVSTLDIGIGLQEPFVDEWEKKEKSTSTWTNTPKT